MVGVGRTEILGKKAATSYPGLDALSPTSPLFFTFGIFSFRTDRDVLPDPGGARSSYIPAGRRCRTSSKLSPLKLAETNTHNVSKLPVDSLGKIGEESGPSTIPSQGNTRAFRHQAVAHTTHPSPITIIQVNLTTCIV